MVSVGGNLYSVPDTTRRRVFEVHVLADEVRILILDENNARLQFVKHALEHNADDGQALAFLEERHREFLEGVIVEDDMDAAPGEESETAPTDAGPGRGSV
jgi:hypothetical protein